MSEEFDEMLELADELDAFAQAACVAGVDPEKVMAIVNIIAGAAGKFPIAETCPALAIVLTNAIKAMVQVTKDAEGLIQ